MTQKDRRKFCRCTMALVQERTENNNTYVSYLTCVECNVTQTALRRNVPLAQLLGLKCMKKCKLKTKKVRPADYPSHDRKCCCRATMTIDLCMPALTESFKHIGHSSKCQKSHYIRGLAKKTKGQYSCLLLCWITITLSVRPHCDTKTDQTYFRRAL